MSSAFNFLINATSEAELLDQAKAIFNLVWRISFDQPGFAVVDVGTEISSKMLRSWMILLKQQLSDIALEKGLRPFNYFSMSRFDQQMTTKFHRDGAPDASLLMLGYEPSAVESRLHMADYTKAAAYLGISPNEFLVEYNPMFKHGEERLLPYTTELPQPLPGHSTIVLINNCSLAPSACGSNSLGVLHQATIINPDKAQRRIINSIMLCVDEPDQVIVQQQVDFVSTDTISGGY
jgi:hypothetical protein